MKDRNASFSLLASVLALAAVTVAGPARAQEPPAPEEPPAATDETEAPKSVEQRLDEIDQKLRVLDRRGEIKDEAEAEKAKSATTATSGKDGFSLKSADGAFVLKIRGYVQFDGRFYADDEQKPAVDTFVLRRVRPILEGTLWKIFDYRVMTDFGAGTTVLQDAYLETRFSPRFKVRAGKFKPPVGIERLQSGTDILFVERALPTALVPNRDLGVQLSGDLAGGRVTYAAGVWNGVVDGGSGDLDSNSGKDAAARVFFQPFVRGESTGLRGLGFGVAASSGSQEGTTTATGLAAYRTDGQQTFFSYRSDGTAAGTVIADGRRERVSPQLTWYVGPFGLLAEYVASSQEVRRGAVEADLENRSWQVAGSWVLGGGGVPTYKAVSPKKPFDPANHAWGAFELAARYAELDVDDDAFPLFASPTSSASLAKAWSVGVNWYFNKNVRWALDYAVTTFEGGAAAMAGIGDREDEKVLFSRFQVSF